LRSVVVKPSAHRVSYKEALVGVRTFKPRFNAAMEKIGEAGWSEERRKQRLGRATVWACPGARPVRSIHDRLWRRVSVKERLGPHSPQAGSLLQLLRARAENRCYNCFARDHRIAQCRDPPKCVLCSKSGHKARYCRAPHRPAGSGEERRARVLDRGEGRHQLEAVPEAEKKMEFIPGEPERRPAKVTACAGRTVAIRDAEREVQLHSQVEVRHPAALPGAGRSGATHL
jgi:hypothetical protein